MSFIHDVGIPQTIVTYGAKEEHDVKWGETWSRFGIQKKATVTYILWQNLAESSILYLKSGIRRALRRINAPRRMWCFSGIWVVAIRILTTLDIAALDGRVAWEDVHGSTLDLPVYALFDWFEDVYYHE